MVDGSTQDVGTNHATLVFERKIQAPVTDVFAAYANARARAQWSAPAGDIIVFDQDEFREGGQDQFRCGPEANPSIVGTTHYFEIVPEERIVSAETLVLDGTRLAISLITTEFDDCGESTSLKSMVQLLSLVGQDMVAGYQHGNNAALDGLEAYFHRKNGHA